MSLPGLAAAGALLFGSTGFLEGLRNIDLNDYAVGVAVSARTLPYRGADTSYTIYPFLTAVEDPTLTTNAFVARDGAFGARRVLDSGFEFGVLGRVETLSFGSDYDPDLAIFDPPAWTLEVGPTIGWRGWTVQPDLSVFKGVLGGHSGITTELSLSVPIKLQHGYVVPYVAAVHQDEDFVSYYYDVPPRPASTGALPPYEARSATNFRMGVRAGYRISDFWVLTGSAWVEALDDVIQDSPLVDEDRLFGTTFGIAYNRSIFRESNPDAQALGDDRRFEFNLTAVAASVDSDLTVPDAVIRVNEVVDLEDQLGIDDDATIYRAEALVRLARKHRLEVGFSELDRSASVVLARDLQFGDVRLEMGEQVTTRYRSRAARASYGYSFLRDEQKEFGVLLGVHWPKLTATLVDGGGVLVTELEADSPAPSFGAFARFALRGNFTARARLQTAYADFDRVAGRLFDFEASADWEPRPWLGLSLGYTLVNARLEGLDRSFVGVSRQRYSGPFAGLRLMF